MKSLTPVAILGIVLAVGLALGWSLHARRFTGAQQRWVEAVKAAHIRSDMAVQDSRKAKAEADSLRRVASDDATEAARLAAAQRQVANATRTAREALDAARTTGDSLRAAIVVVGAVEAERDTALATGDRWRSAYQREFQAANVLALRGDSLERVVARQDSLLQTGTRVVGSSGCRIPILGWNCGVVIGYGAQMTGGVVTTGLQATVGVRVF